MSLSKRMSDEDEKVAELAEMIDAEVVTNEEFDRETDGQTPTIDNGLIRLLYAEMNEPDGCDEYCEGDCDNCFEGCSEDCDGDCEARFEEGEECVDEYCPDDSELCEGCSPSITDEELEMFACKDCTVNTYEIDEYYMVQFSMWQTVVPFHLQDDMLCIGCLEVRLGRKLSTSDFTEAPVNYMGLKSDRLKDRLGDWFTGELYDPEEETLMEATQRLARQRGW